jgi:hypothetical protein
MINAASHWKEIIAAASFAVALLASPASAQRADDMRGGGQNPCAPDAQRICSAFIPDRAKVASCLFQNKRQLSSACRAELGGGGKKVRKAKLHSSHHGHHHRRHHH